MKKIMFNDKYELTKAVLEGRKTITRRVVSMHDYKYGFQVWYDIVSKKYWVCDGDENFIVERSQYSKGEVVAVAQSYRDINERGIVQFKPTLEPDGMIYGDNMRQVIWAENHAGWNNKMFVKSEPMPHHIKITNIRVERLQDISDEDCLREGVVKNTIGYYVEGLICKNWEKESHVEMENGDTLKLFPTPREAFAALIDKVSGKGTWERNPYVWVYEFELVD